MVPWSSVHRTLALGLVGAVAAATVLVGPNDPDGPSDTTPVSVEGEDSTLQEQEVPLVDDPDVDAGEPAPETLEDAPEDPQGEADPQDEGEEGGGQGGGDPDAPVAQLERTGTDPFNMVGVTWEGGADLRVEVSHRTAGQWSAFEDLEVEPVDPTEGGRAGTEPLWINDGADGVSVRITSASGELPRDVKVATIDPGEDGLVAPTSGAPGQPSIIMRSSWGAKSASCSTGRPATRGATIHHTAGNNTYSQAQVAGILRSYQDYHRSRGWCDIGYNFLVDRFGRIYEGRVGGITNMVRGAHAGTNGANTYTVGIAMMGTFTNVMPTAATRESVANLVAWRFGRSGVPAKGTHTLDGRTQQRIIGHRDVKATECPGRTAYTWVTGGLRDSVAAKLKAGSGFDWSAPSGVRVRKSDTFWDLSWSSAPGPVSFMVEVSTSASMSSPRTVVVDGTEGRISGLRASTRYYMRVATRHSRTGARTSAYSPVVSGRSFDWPAPTGVTASSSAPTTGAVRWTAVPGAVAYTVQVSTNASMSSPVTQATTQPSATLTKLQAGRDYYVRVFVRHSRTGAQTSAVSPVATFTTASASEAESWDWPAPTDVAPTVATNSGVGLAWKSVPGPKAFIVEVSRDRSMTNTTEHRIDGTTGVVSGLDKSSTYFARVATRHSRTGARTSAFSPVVETTTMDWSSPNGVRVRKADTSWALSWNAVPGAATYLVEVSRSPLMTDPVEHRFETNSGTVTGLRPSTQYYMRVAVRHSRTGARTSAFSPVVSGRSFDWPAPPTPTAAGVSSSGATLSWPAVAGVKTYTVQVSRSASMSSPKTYRVSTNRATVSGLQPSTGYHARVSVSHSRTSEQTSAFSPTRAFSTSAGTSSTNSVNLPASGSVTLKGRGFGHGIGMSQYGSLGGASSGANAAQILNRYYPGTSVVSRSTRIRVLISADSNGSVEVLARSGMRFVQGSRTIDLPATVSGRTVDRWRIEPRSSDARQSVLRYRSGSRWYSYQSLWWNGEAQFMAPTMDLVLAGVGTVRYRDTLRAAQPSSGSTTRRTVNVLDLNEYTRGVVARESPASWPHEALRAQSIAARTYGLRSISSGGWYDICDTTSCQVYGGVAAEDPRTDRAVSSSKDRVLVYQGTPAFTQFSSSSGGFTNQGSQPYLRPVSDPWDGTSANPNRSWTQNVSVSTIRSRYPSIGTPRRMQVTKRNGHGTDGGRVSSLQIVGSSGSVTVTGPAARSAFGLKSDWFGF